MEYSDDFKSLSNEKFTTKEKEILEKNKKFFSTDFKYIKEMLEIINGESNISIRVLDWFVSNYSKKNNTFYKIKINGRDEYFYVNNQYKNQLNGYSKQYFDPFCRKKKVAYTYKNNDNDNNNDNSKDITFLSSIGQLNFFQWAICNKVIRYVKRHIKEIEEDMKETSRKNKERKLAMIKEFKKSAKNNNDFYSDEPDPIICSSSDKINNIKISPIKKISSNSKSDSDGRSKRMQLSKSVYDFGIKKTNIPIKLDFD